jgi:hypothetical protein
MTIRLTLLLAAFALATPAVAGGHPNGKPSEFYAIQRGTDMKRVDRNSTGSIEPKTKAATPACTSKACKSR